MDRVVNTGLCEYIFDFIEVNHKVKKSMQILSLGSSNTVTKDLIPVEKIKYNNMKTLSISQKNYGDGYGGDGYGHAAP